jgi:hypothetical protein
MGEVLRNISARSRPFSGVRYLESTVLKKHVDQRDSATSILYVRIFHYEIGNYFQRLSLTVNEKPSFTNLSIELKIGVDEFNPFSRRNLWKVDHRELALTVTTVCCLA